jgi:hypothetical protein
MKDKLIDNLYISYDRGQMTSVRWYKETVRKLFEQATPQSLMSDASRLVSKVTPGYMYCFFYDPLHKATLPYYDTFPLVLPFQPAAGGFLGINFHYLPYGARTALLNKLLQFRSNKHMNENTIIQTSWQMLKSASTISLVKPAVKHYLSRRVGSKYLELYANEWATSVMLPVERFVGATSQEVWKDSKKKMG